MTHRNSTYPDITKEALKKAYEELAATVVGDFRTEAMVQLLASIEHLEYLAKEWEEYEPPRVTFAEDAIAAKVLRDETSDAVSDEAPAPEPTPTPEPEVAKMSDQELRGYFTTARKKGLNVSAFIKELGAGNLTELTAQQRVTAVEKLKAGGYV